LEAPRLRTDIAVFRPASGLWAVRRYTQFYLGADGDSPVTGDFDGNSLDDIGILRGTPGLWTIKKISRAYFGRTGDIPVTR